MERVRAKLTSEQVEKLMLGGKLVINLPPNATELEIVQESMMDEIVKILGRIKKK